MRHLWAWWRGEDRDEETGLSHLAHAACCVMFLMTFQARRMSHLDDRPSRVVATPNVVEAVVIPYEPSYSNTPIKEGRIGEY